MGTIPRYRPRIDCCWCIRTHKSFDDSNVFHASFNVKNVCWSVSWRYFSRQSIVLCCAFMPVTEFWFFLNCNEVLTDKESKERIIQSCEESHYQTCSSVLQIYINWWKNVNSVLNKQTKKQTKISGASVYRQVGSALAHFADLNIQQ